MKQLVITYRPISFLPFKRTIRGAHPEKWEEVTTAQFKIIASSARAKTDIGFLHAMTGIKKSILRKLGDYRLYKLGELFSFVNSADPHNAFVIGKIKPTPLCPVLFAPRPKLKGMTFGRFIFADTHFGNYQEDKTPEELHRFIAALYIPENKIFSEELIDRNYKKIKQLPAATVEAICLNYSMVKQWLVKTYPLLFVTPESDLEHENAPLNNGDEERSDGGGKFRDPSAWIKTFENLVGDDIVNQDKYAALPVNNVFRYMSRLVKENMKRKK